MVSNPYLKAIKRPFGRGDLLTFTNHGYSPLTSTGSPSSRSTEKYPDAMVPNGAVPQIFGAFGQFLFHNFAKGQFARRIQALLDISIYKKGHHICMNTMKYTN